jgi:hypothetical protein
MMGWMAPLRHRSAKLVENHQEREPSMSEITTIGLDLGKHRFTGLMQQVGRWTCDFDSAPYLTIMAPRGRPYNRESHAGRASLRFIVSRVLALGLAPTALAA